jgi:hypothetical protein
MLSDAISPIWWGVCLGAAAAVDLKGIQNARYSDAVDVNSGSSSVNGEQQTYRPGDYNWDPLNLYPTDEEGQFRMQLAEIKHGRLGMLAITGFAVQEYVFGDGVVDETPGFFEPFNLF